MVKPSQSASVKGSQALAPSSEAAKRVPRSQPSVSPRQATPARVRVTRVAINPLRDRSNLFTERGQSVETAERADNRRTIDRDGNPAGLLPVR